MSDRTWLTLRTAMMVAKNGTGGQMRIVQALGTILLVVIVGCGGDGDNEPTGPTGDADVSGTWMYSATVDDGESICSFSGVTLVLDPGGASSASGGTVTCGTVSGPFPDIDVTGPIVDGSRVTFAFGTVIHDGDVSGDSMSGIIADDEPDLSLSGEWSAVR